MQPELTNNIHTLPLEYVAKEEFTSEYGMYPKDRVITPIQPTVVRQDSPEGPKYQEALTYQFLINGSALPGIARMDDGKLVLSMAARLEPGTSSVDSNGWQWVMLSSEDEGRTWSRPRRVPMFRAMLVNLGGDRLLAFNLEDDQGFRFSDNAGETWSEKELIPTLPDGREYWTDLSYQPMIEGSTAYFVLYAVDPVQTFIRPYNFNTHKWGEPTFFPKDPHGRLTSEGSVTRAQNGDLVAVLRTTSPGIPSYSDHWRGIATTRSTDDGKTWSELTQHSLLGNVHATVQTLADGRILMTYASRIGELEGMVFHGIEAVLSYDNGLTWDWDHRYILCRWPLDQGMHSPQSRVLSDGRILTIYAHTTSFPWTDTDTDPWTNGVNVVNIGNVSVVIWRLEAGGTPE